MKLVYFFIFILTIPHFGLTQHQDETKEPHMLFSIFFGGGSFQIDEQQQNDLVNFITTIENLSNYQIIISGHTDNIGGKEFNEWLSDMRTKSVKAILLENNVPEDLIHLKRFGQDNPLYNNRSHQGRMANRRVDVILIPIIF